MGAWSVLPLGNDSANDWAAGLTESRGTGAIASLLCRVLKQEARSLGVSDVEEAIAAIDALTRLMGRGTYHDAYTQKVDHWARGQKIRPNAALIAKARAMLTRVQAPESPLRDLWAEAGKLDGWEASLAALQIALRK